MTRKQTEEKYPSMDNDPIHPMAWRLVALAVLPGLWLIVQQTPHPYFPIDVLEMFGSAAGTVIIAAFLLWASWRRGHYVALWGLPLFGVLAWQFFDFANDSFWAGRAHLISPLWFTSTFILALLIGIVWAVGLLPGWLYRCLKLPAPPRFWLLAGALAVLLAAMYLFIKGIPIDQIMLLSYFQWAAFIAPVALGTIFARRYGLAACLLVVACEPLGIDLLVTPQHITFYDLMRNSSYYHLELFTFDLSPIVLAYAYFFLFLVVLPIGLLRSRTRREQLAWLLIPSFMTLTLINIVPGTVLQGTNYTYSLAQWFQVAFGVLVLWIPLPLCSALYVAIERTAAHQQAWSSAPSNAASAPVSR
jgi:hypothetical protein